MERDSRRRAQLPKNQRRGKALADTMKPEKIGHAAQAFLAVLFATMAVGLQTGQNPEESPNPGDHEAAVDVAASASPDTAAAAHEIGDVMQTGAFAHWRIQVLSMLGILLVFVGGHLLSQRGIPERVFFLWKGKQLDGGMVPIASSSSRTECETLEEGEKKPLLIPRAFGARLSAQQPHKTPPHCSIFEWPIYRYGGLDAAMDAVNGSSSFAPSLKNEIAPSLIPRNLSSSDSTPRSAEESNTNTNTALASAKEVLAGIYSGSVGGKLPKN